MEENVKGFSKEKGLFDTFNQKKIGAFDDEFDSKDV
jgi:hypothetical protein